MRAARDTVETTEIISSAIKDIFFFDNASFRWNHISPPYIWDWSKCDRSNLTHRGASREKKKPLRKQRTVKKTASAAGAIQVNRLKSLKSHCHASRNHLMLHEKTHFCRTTSLVWNADIPPLHWNDISKQLCKFFCRSAMETRLLTQSPRASRSFLSLSPLSVWSSVIF